MNTQDSPTPSSGETLKAKEVNPPISSNKHDQHNLNIDQETNSIDSFPAIKGWKTSIGFSILGGAASLVLMLVFTFVGLFVTACIGVSANQAMSCSGVIGAIIQNLICIVYAFWVYPSFFKEKPLIKNRNAISLLNLMFGGVIFGCIWNQNLTYARNENNPAKGVSYIVFTVLSALIIIVNIVNFAVIQLPAIEQHKVYQELKDLQAEVHESIDPRLLRYDDSNGVSFAVPEDWYDEYESSSSYNALYIFPEDNGLAAIMYCFDFSGMMKDAIEREAFVEIVLGASGEPVDSSVNKVVIDNVEYEHVQGNGFRQLDGEKIQVAYDAYFLVNTDRPIAFIYEEFENSKFTNSYYDAFEELMKSVVYAS